MLEAQDSSPRQVLEGTICFLGSPVFDVDVWRADGLWYGQPKELDIVAFADSERHLAPKLGEMIEDLLFFLIEEVPEDDLTESEQATASLLVDRLGPALARYHARQRRAALFRRVRAALTRGIEWKLGPASTHHESVPVLSA